MKNQDDELRARDAHAGHYERSYSESKGYFYDWVEKKSILAALGPEKNDVILDVGCGTGRISRLLAGKCGKVYGLDFSPKSIEVLNASARALAIKNVETAVWDITKPFPLKEKVDRAVSVQVIQHLLSDELRQAAVKNVFDQLKPGGSFVLVVYNWRQFERNGGAKEGSFDNGIYYFRFTSEEAGALLGKCGFKNISVTGCLHFNMVGRFQGRIWELLLAPFALADFLFSRLRLFPSSGDFLICRGVK